MPAISFQEEWIDELLRGDKQQTTRAQTDRIKVGDVCTIYNQQRRQITDKLLRTCTRDGKWIIRGLMNKRAHYPQVFYDRFGDIFYPHRLDWESGSPQYYAHLLGKVEITKTYEMQMYDNFARSAWAKADGFDNFTCADTWFTEKYGDNWDMQAWTVICWDGWLERYFEAER